jgi:GntR family transcriptional repressor for pyruvate dehydrogenase complex
MRAMVELLRKGIFYNRQQLYLRSGARQILLSQHAAIAEAVLTGDPDAAEAAAKEHIGFTAETILEIRRDQSRLESSLNRGGRDAFLAQGSVTAIQVCHRDWWLDLPLPSIG